MTLTTGYPVEEEGVSSRSPVQVVEGRVQAAGGQEGGPSAQVGSGEKVFLTPFV